MFFPDSYYYYLSIGLQALCVLHCLKKGNQNKWIWIIVFLPVVGCLAYFFTEILTRRGLQTAQSGIGALFNPGGSVRRLEENLQFADTFRNRVALADAYLQAGETGKAVALYEESLTGTFATNEHVRYQLVLGYYQQQRYADAIALAQGMQGLPQFTNSKAHILYALALDREGYPEKAEREFSRMNARFCNYEARYHFALLLSRTGRAGEGRKLLSDMLGETRHISRPERRDNREWFARAKAALKEQAV